MPAKRFENPEDYHIDLGYPFKVWIKTIFIIAPVLILVVTFLMYITILDRWFDDLPTLMIIVSFSVVLSLPTLGCTYLAFWYSRLNQYSPFNIKIVCAGVSLLGIAITFAILKGQLALGLMTIYTTSSVLAFSIQKLQLF